MEPCLTLQRGVFNQCNCPTFSICVCVCFPLEPDGGGLLMAAVTVVVMVEVMMMRWQQRCSRCFWLCPPVFTGRLSSVTGILGWIIRITLLLLKNTRS